MSIRRALAASALTLSTLASAGAAELALTPCRLDGLEGEARCGSLAVPEDRNRPDGRVITVPVVVVPAKTATPKGAVAFLAGGPGASSIASAAGAASHAGTLREERDLLFVDTRGLGGPDRLFCSELAERGNMQSFYEEFLPPAKAARCRERLAATHDLTRYTTEEGADDLEAVRRALGYGPLDLVGASYGTRFALVYARRHPASVRTLLLYGAVATDERIPLHFASYFESALMATFEACAAEPACRERFPGLRDDLAAAVARLVGAPVPVELTDPSSGEPFRFVVTRAGFAQALRYMLYLPSSALLVPATVHAAAGGDFRPVAEAAQTFFTFAASDFADGYYLSVTCSEDVPFILEAEIAAATGGTLLGDFRIRQQQAACAAWTAQPVDAAFLEPVRSAAPTLIVSGERDPVTPAKQAERIASTLPAARHVVVPDAGHDVGGLVGLDCLERLEAEFIRTANAERLDTACVASIRRPPFVLGLPGSEAPDLGREELERLAGSFAASNGLQATVALGDDGRLRLTIFGKPPSLLVPRSARRFGIAGLPPTFAVEFRLDADGRAVAFAVDEGAGPSLVLERRDGAPPAP
jgi:pimeloyl-ACP methyl ester carboxylesterase